MTAQERLSRDSANHGRKEFRRAFLSRKSLMADCRTADDIFRERVSNLSASGLFLETKRRLAIGQEIAMTVTLADSQDMIIKATGKVVRKTYNGVGVAFTIVFNY